MAMPLTFGKKRADTERNGKAHITLRGYIDGRGLQ